MRAWVAALLAGGLAAATLLAVMAWRHHRRHASAKPASDRVDTVVGWMPEATRVLTQAERAAYQTLLRALPDHTVLAQVSLARFLKVPKRRSYGEWLGRVGYLSADLVVCDKATNVVAVVDVHSARDSERSRQRYERMARVLKAAGIRVVVWDEAAIPDPEKARAQLLSEVRVSAPMPLSGSRLATELPVAEVSELDDHDTRPTAEPAPSTLFDDLDSTGIGNVPHERR